MIHAMDVQLLVVFHEIGTDPMDEFPEQLDCNMSEVAIKCIPSDENAEERLKTFRSIPNTLDYFLFYDSTGCATMCDRKGKGSVKFWMGNLGGYIGHHKRKRQSRFI